MYQARIPRLYYCIAALLWFPLVCGCATSTFNSRDKTDVPLALSEQVDVNEKTPTGEKKSASMLGYLPGKHVAADVPYVKTLPWIGAPEANEKVAQAQFIEAESQFEHKRYHEARVSYEQAADYLPDSALHEDALFMIAEAHFFDDNYPEAFRAYETLLTSYKRSRHMDAAVNRQFLIGQYWKNRHQKDPDFILTPNLTDKTRPFNDLQGSALRAFEKVRLNHPTGQLADDSLMATASTNFLRKRYEDADYHYTLVRREYPNSEHQYQAHLLGIQAKIRRYQGPQYDGTCLNEAKELIEQTLRQFQKMSVEDRSRLEKLHAQVQSNLARRDYEVGYFYANKGFNDAARFYYGRVIDKFSHTGMAQEAREQLTELEGEPSVPAPRFVWLSSLFPDVREDPLVLNREPEPDTDSQ